MSIKIAVYGTLMKGFRNYNKFLMGKVRNVEKGVVKGRLYHLVNLNCPALVEGTDTVYIEIVTLEGDIKSIIKELDIVEGYVSKDNKNNVYNRVMHKIYNEDTDTEEVLEIYKYNMYNPDISKGNMIYIPSGNWRDYMKDKDDTPSASI